LNLQDGKKVAKDMVHPPGTKTKSSKRMMTVECSPKRKKLQEKTLLGRYHSFLAKLKREEEVQNFKK
jgi:hypothetical protein